MTERKAWMNFSTLSPISSWSPLLVAAQLALSLVRLLSSEVVTIAFSRRARGSSSAVQ